MTKAQQSARDEAIATLRETLKPGTVVYTILRNVSRSGMSRDSKKDALRELAVYPHSAELVGKWR